MNGIYDEIGSISGVLHGVSSIIYPIIELVQLSRKYHNSAPVVL